VFSAYRRKRLFTLTTECAPPKNPLVFSWTMSRAIKCPSRARNGVGRDRSACSAPYHRVSSNRTSGESARFHLVGFAVLAQDPGSAPRFLTTCVQEEHQRCATAAEALSLRHEFPSYHRVSNFLKRLRSETNLEWSRLLNRCTSRVRRSIAHRYSRG
jgi:hypothetical protein